MVRKISFEISFTNKWFYTFITIGIIAMLSVVVYASNPSVFGHSAEELDGVCKSDGTGCPSTLSCGISGNTITCPDGTSLSDTKQTKGQALYKVTNQYCSGYKSVTFSANCETSVYGYSSRLNIPYYYNCDGSRKSSKTSKSCPNTRKGYLIN